jgi:hypothetical protein
MIFYVVGIALLVRHDKLRQALALLDEVLTSVEKESAGREGN